MPGLEIAKTFRMSLSRQNYISAVRCFLAGEENKALDLVSAGNELQVRLLRARSFRRKGQLLLALNELEIPADSNDPFYQAEVMDQKAQVYRHLDIQKSEEYFRKSAQMYLLAGHTERSLECESNALSVSESGLTTWERYKEWSQLYKRCVGYPIAEMGVLLAFYECAIECNSPEKNNIAENLKILLEKNIYQQDRLVYHLLSGEEAFRLGKLAVLREELESANRTFLDTPVVWLKTRLDLLAVRELVIEGQVVKAKAMILLIERRPSLRPKDRLELLVLKYLYLKSHDLFSDFEADVKLLDPARLTHYQLLKLELLKASVANDEVKKRDTEAKCLEDQSYSLLGHMGSSSVASFEVFAISRKIVFPDKSEKFFRANSKTFELLIVLLQAKSKKVTKEELFEMVWRKRMVEKADENIFYVNMANLKKIIGAEKIISKGSVYEWNAEQEYVLHTGI